MDTELVCYNPSTGKAEGMGELKGGMVFDISLGMARRLLMKKVKEQGGITVLDLLAEKLAFEIAVGRNGKIWIDASGVNETLAIGNILRETDEKVLDFEAQKKLVGKKLRELGKS
jgi:exosome complex component RRP40